MGKSLMKYVLLTDVVGSRKIADRRSFEKKLAQTLQRVQQQYAGVFELPIQIWKGLDETAALVKEPWRLYSVMDSIDEGLAPNIMRAVLVKGTIDVMPPDGIISKADGDVFHDAAARMLELKKWGLKYSCSTGNENFDAAWQSQLNLLGLVKQAWTVKQRQIYRLYCETGVQDDVARRLKISQQQVSKTLKSIGAAQVQQLEKSVERWTESGFKQ